jgi:hypothetical protein
MAGNQAGHGARPGPEQQEHQVRMRQRGLRQMLFINRHASRVRSSVGDGLRLITTLDHHLTD